ncbi:RHS repeat-associated core domain-containing protein [Streptomyces sp. NPDC091278]|uniref:RHS repeat-associated core domain-containing protein n=1 Tax=Streptomyces sp. NPDC091278 TaxID=3155301 RepID=UPI00344D8BE0
MTIPKVTGEEFLAGTYTVATTATPVKGLPLTAVYSTTNPSTGAATALPAETVTHHYGSDDTLAIVDSSLDHAYLRGASYTPYGELAQAQLGNLAKLVTQTLTYETSTRRLVKNQINRAATGPATLSNITYGYDQTGNITSIKDAQNDGTVTDDQCFSYDWARRLTDAWSSGDACATKSVNGTGTPDLGTVDPYRTSWTFTDTGQRRTETQYKAGAITADTTRTYEYPTTKGAAQAHAVTSVTATGGATGTDAYTYDDTGNLTKKAPAGGAVQDLAWDPEGKLRTSTISGQTTSFLYDAEGTRILKRDPAKTTLYLPGGQELELTRAVGTTTAAVLSNGTRYYAVPGGSAIRTSKDSSVRILVSDHHNTNTLSISASSLAVNRRKTLPYGGQRGAAPYFWPGTKGFVGGDIDTTTGLTHIGAREYDTALGQFISVDPLLEIDKPQTLNGYGYAANNPITFSDPTGTCLDAGNGHCEDDSAWTPDNDIRDDGGQSTFPPEEETETQGAGTNGNQGGNTGGGKKGKKGPDDSKPSCSLYPIVSGKRSALPIYYGTINYPKGYPTDPAFLAMVDNLGPYDIAEMWMNGLGQYIPDLIFGPQSKMTRMIAGTDHNKSLEKSIAEMARQNKFDNVGPESAWHKANRPGSWKDALGLVTRFGNPEFETVVGTWSEKYQVTRINRDNRTVTVNFKASNNTNWSSFCHDHACGGTNISSGTGAGVSQRFYWTKVISLDQWSTSPSY